MQTVLFSNYIIHPVYSDQVYLNGNTQFSVGYQECYLTDGLPQDLWLKQHRIRSLGHKMSVFMWLAETS